MAYTNNVPQGNQTFAFTQPFILNNFAYLQTSIGKEHNFDVSDPTQTYHLQASMPDQSDPTVLPDDTNGMYYVGAGLPKYFDGTTPYFIQLSTSPGAGGAGGLLSLIDDFVCGTSAGNIGWSNNGSGSSTYTPDTTLSAGRPGIMEIDTGAGSGAGAMFLLGASGGRPIILGGGVLTIQFWMQLPALSTSGNRFTVRMGLSDQTGNNASNVNPTNGCYFVYTDNTNSGQWQIVTNNATSPTIQNTANAADTSFHSFKIVVNADASSVAFYIDGTQVTNSPLTLTIPAAAVCPFVWIQHGSGAAGSAIVNLDLFALSIALTTPR